GLVMHDLARQGLVGRLVACLLAGFLAEMMTVTTFHWYRDTRRYLDAQGCPVRTGLPPWSELVIREPVTRLSGRASVPRGGTSRKFAVPTDVTHVLGGYWDVYRMAFLSGKRVIGVPFPMYPNRFPDWSRGLGPDRGRLLVLRPGEESSPGALPAAELPGG